MQENADLTGKHPVVENSASQMEEPTMRTEEITQSVFPDKQYPNDWHVEEIDTKSGDISAAVFSGPDAEIKAREYAEWQESKRRNADRTRAA